MSLKLIMPVWMVFVNPVSWVAILPGFFVLSVFTVWISMLITNRDKAWELTKLSVWRAYIVTYIQYIVGIAFMLIPSFLSISVGGDWLSRFSKAMLDDIYSNPLCVLWAVLSITASAAVVFSLDRLWTLKKALPDKDSRLKAALWRAVIAAPYIFLATFKLYY